MFRTFDKRKAWDNPNLHIPLEKAHLTMVNDSDPLFYEQLCIKHDQIVPDQKKENNRRQIDASMLEYLFEKPFEHWDNVSL